MGEQGAGRTIVLVGHCRADSFMLQSAIHSLLPKAAVRGAGDDAALEAAAAGADLLLVNRVLEGGFGSPDGEALAGRWGGGGRPRVMLVSNLADAQERAVKAGALRGFGKAELRTERMRHALLTGLDLPVECE